MRFLSLCVWIDSPNKYYIILSLYYCFCFSESPLLTQRRRTCLSGLTWWCPYVTSWAWSSQMTFLGRNFLIYPHLSFFPKVTQRVCEPAGESIWAFECDAVLYSVHARELYNWITKSAQNLVIIWLYVWFCAAVHPQILLTTCGHLMGMPTIIYDSGHCLNRATQPPHFLCSSMESHGVSLDKALREDFTGINEYKLEKMRLR